MGFNFLNQYYTSPSQGLDLDQRKSRSNVNVSRLLERKVVIFGFVIQKTAHAPSPFVCAVYFRFDTSSSTELLGCSV